MREEYELAQGLNHPNVVKYHQILVANKDSEGSGSIYIVMEYMKGGDLKSFIGSYIGKGSIPLNKVNAKAK